MILRVIRPTWKPETDEHRRLVVKVVRAARKVRAAEAELWEAFAEARAAGVAVNYAAEQAEVPRATVYRHIGAPSPEAATVTKRTRKTN